MDSINGEVPHKVVMTTVVVMVVGIRVVTTTIKDLLDSMITVATISKDNNKEGGEGMIRVVTDNKAMEIIHRNKVMKGIKPSSCDTQVLLCLCSLLSVLTHDMHVLMYHVWHLTGMI